ncbi:RNA polymerase sigma factor [Glaciecola sp. XM2]|jgi:RNA polymerase sigma-70 factor (ECF subfamily)|uniref:RNA polymerase sigma factor n=1 Tax=Glaciecola sp. XM2 TaxID=1914931 RepID=UPI001BDE7BC7|nr:RNA polymerase sigma factor [Glaciecola sp. XM2]MBT1450064.1 RNA polymerase sigma factor [Glaciecola sp. XM2]
MQKHLIDLVNDAYRLAANIVGQPDDAYDVMQDAATIALTKRKESEYADAEFKPWFFKVVRNKAIDRLRANTIALKRQQADCQLQNNNQPDDAHSILPHASSNEPDMLLSQAQSKQRIDLALASISASHREIILLKDYHDFSYAQIAEILAIANGSVMSRLFRARQSLKTELLKLAEKGEYNE